LFVLTMWEHRAMCTVRNLCFCLDPPPVSDVLVPIPPVRNNLPEEMDDSSDDICYIAFDEYELERLSDPKMEGQDFLSESEFDRIFDAAVSMAEVASTVVEPDALKDAVADTAVTAQNSTSLDQGQQLEVHVPLIDRVLASVVTSLSDMGPLQIVPVTLRCAGMQTEVSDVADAAVQTDCFQFDANKESPVSVNIEVSCQTEQLEETLEVGDAVNDELLRVELVKSVRSIKYFVAIQLCVYVCACLLILSMAFFFFPSV